MSATTYKMTEMIFWTSAHLIDRSEDVVFELVWVSLSYQMVNIVVSSLFYL